MIEIFQINAFDIKEENFFFTCKSESVCVIDQNICRYLKLEFISASITPNVEKV